MQFPTGFCSSISVRSARWCARGLIGWRISYLYLPSGSFLVNASGHSWLPALAMAWIPSTATARSSTVRLVAKNSLF